MTACVAMLRAAVLCLCGAAFGGAFLAWAFATVCTFAARCIAVPWAATFRTFRTTVCAFRFRFGAIEDVAGAVLTEYAIELGLTGAFCARVDLVAFPRRVVAIVVAGSSVVARIAIFTRRAFTPFRIAMRTASRLRTRFLRTRVVWTRIMLTSSTRRVALIAV